MLAAPALHSQLLLPLCQDTCNQPTGSTGPSCSQVIEAAQAACIHDTIMNRFPLKYDTVVGERGLRLRWVLGRPHGLPFARLVAASAQVRHSGGGARPAPQVLRAGQLSVHSMRVVAAETTRGRQPSRCNTLQAAIGGSPAANCCPLLAVAARSSVWRLRGLFSRTRPSSSWCAVLCCAVQGGAVPCRALWCCSAASLPQLRCLLALRLTRLCWPDPPTYTSTLLLARRMRPPLHWTASQKSGSRWVCPITWRGTYTGLAAVCPLRPGGTCSDWLLRIEQL